LTRTQLLEESIVTQIQTQLPALNYDVASMPTNVDEFDHVKTKPQVWVMLHSVVADKEGNTDVLVQEASYVFQISLKAPQLREDGGIYFLFDRVCKALLGKRPALGSGRLKVHKNGLQHNGIMNGIFDYSVYFECPAMLFVEDYDDETGGYFGTTYQGGDFETMILRQDNPPA